MSVDLLALAKRAGIVAPSETALAPNVEAFAKLIVNECAGVYEAIDNGNQVKGTNNYLKALQLRFGVK